MTFPSTDPLPPRGCPAHTGRTRLYGPEFTADPKRVYTKLREDHGAIAPVELAPGTPAHLVLTYDAVLEVVRNPNTFPRDPRRWQAMQAPDNPVLPLMGYRPNCMFTDGSEHQHLRAAITDSLDRVNPNQLRNFVEGTARSIIGGFSANGSADLVADYALPLSLDVANYLFGCPPDLGARHKAGMQSMFDMIDAEKAGAELIQSMRELIALKRREPGHDLPTWMMAHPNRLTDDQLVHQLIVLMGAGTEPQRNLIANGIRLLLSDDRFAGDLTGGSMPVEEALDEILWTDPPIANYCASYPPVDVDFHGTRLPAHQPLVLSFAAANLDPALADHRARNRAHLAWSAGVHTCPAQQSARVIAVAAIETLLDALPDLRLAIPDEQLEWRPGGFHRALAALPVHWPPVLSVGEPERQSNAQSESSTPPPATSSPKTPVSSNTSPRRWWNTLANWWAGR